MTHTEPEHTAAAEASLTVAGGFDEQTIANALCIDLARGSAYAWVYLARCGASPDEIRTILRAAPGGHAYLCSDIFAAAQQALEAVGMQVEERHH